MHGLAYSTLAGLGALGGCFQSLLGSFGALHVPSGALQGRRRVTACCCGLFPGQSWFLRQRGCAPERIRESIPFLTFSELSLPVLFVRPLIPVLRYLIALPSNLVSFGGSQVPGACLAVIFRTARMRLSFRLVGHLCSFAVRGERVNSICDLGGTLPVPV